ncbi:HPr kinase/phosphatase C-terminal domain-containing protein [uncultured Sphingomonas sp.]|uniref:HPr kinase/phosphorylase n=1 Tax=uncultured Sphingomonas sp. TaxID=158754 RepID=UPI0025E7D0C8|nr:HPr kinase/phosphatase C-terminal domain-containing protein [uncultured Sphingomonas sp.]
MSETLHATCVAIRGRGLLLTGASGSGKSDLALRLIDRGAMLVGDDGVIVEARGGQLFARSGPHIEGRIEVRGLGIVALPYVEEAPLGLCIALDQPVPRMPDEPLPVRIIAGLPLPVLALDPFESSAPVKVEKALLLYGLTA